MKFVKNQNKWYFDLPNWTGRKGALQMVSGADKMLELLSNEKNYVNLLVSRKFYDGADIIKLKRKSLINGAHYNVINNETNFNLNKIWLCGVTEKVFGEYPQEIFFSKINNIIHNEIQEDNKKNNKHFYNVSFNN